MFSNQLHLKNAFESQSEATSNLPQNSRGKFQWAGKNTCGACLKCEGCLAEKGRENGELWTTLMDLKLSSLKNKNCFRHQET